MHKVLMQNQIAAKVLLFFGICKRLSVFCYFVDCL